MKDIGNNREDWLGILKEENLYRNGGGKRVEEVMKLSFIGLVIERDWRVLSDILFDFDRNRYLLLRDSVLQVEMSMIVFKTRLLLILED